MSTTHELLKLLVQDRGAPKTRIYVEWSRKRNDDEPTGGVADPSKKKPHLQEGGAKLITDSVVCEFSIKRVRFSFL